MKIRNGFVSNSSSSSFVINKDCLSLRQFYMIKNHINVAQHVGMYVNEGDSWQISENEYEVFLDTNMDNFDMYYFLTKYVKVDKDDIQIDY